MLEVQVQNESLLFLPQKAIYWISEKTLVLSDIHLGKTEHFRKNGIAVPMESQVQDVTRLSELVSSTGAQRVIIAGDMFHSQENNAVESFSHWRELHPSLELHLVLGNHDIIGADKYYQIGLIVHESTFDLGPFLISHDEIENPEKFYMHGHIHPSIRLERKGRNKSLRLPCFCQDNCRLILPSFGSFTGRHDITKSGFSQVYVIVENQVIKW